MANSKCYFKKTSWLAAATFLGLTSFTGKLMAAKVVAIKGKIVEVEGVAGEFTANSVWDVRNADRKKVGIIKIKAVQGTKAKGIFKGDVQPQYVITPRSQQREKRSVSRKTGKRQLGGLAGFNFTTAETKVGTETLTLTGSDFSVKFLVDYYLFKSFWFRGTSGLEQFSVGGKNDTDCGGECTANIKYFTLDFWGQYRFGEAKNFWAGAGFGFLIPVAKNTTAFAESSVTNLNVFLLGGGWNYQLKKGSYIPIQVEYDIYPSSNTVEASAYAVRIGYSKDF
jgi:hypothetical protein